MALTRPALKMLEAMLEASNLPLPDQLNDVRTQITALKAYEEELKAQLIADPKLRSGTDFIVEINVVTKMRTDLKELRKAAPELVDTHTHPVTETRVELRGITEDGEIVSVRKFRKLQEAEE